jgi:hypothetical protein
VLDLGAGRVFAQVVVALPVPGGSNGPGHKATAAIGADVAYNFVDAGCTERAFIRANARF